MSLESILSNRKTFIAFGVSLILLSVVILTLMVWEIFGSSGNRFFNLELPGFHELELKNPGLYAGIYQHQGSQPIPTSQLASMDVRVISKDSFEQIPVLMNTTGQSFHQMGVRGMTLFNFLIQQPGTYTLSGVYTQENGGPTINVLLLSQAVQEVKGKLMVGVLFSLGFLVLGIRVLMKSKTWGHPIS